MPLLSNVERDYLILDLVKNKLGEFFDLKPPKLNFGVGPNDPREFDKLFDFRDELKARLVKSLDDLSEQELMLLSEPSGATDQVLIEWWNDHLSSEISSLPKMRPPPIEVGWGHPSFEPDYVYWCQMPEFTLHEAVMLSVGCEPEIYSEEQVARMHKEKKLWPALQFLLKRKELLRRHFVHTAFGNAPMRIGSFLNLIDEIDLEVPPKLLEQFRKRLTNPVPPSVEVGDDPEPRLWKLERTSLLKLVAAMGCEQYGYDPNQEKNPAVGSIRDDLDSVGLSMDPKTIRKWLTEATELVPSDYWKN